MQYFDVLSSHSWAEGTGRRMYFVTTVRAQNQAAARAKAVRSMESFFVRHNRGLVETFVHGCGPVGSYSQFVGKYVGQFIDEALCR